VADDWRLTARLTDEGTRRLLDQLREHEADDAVRHRLGGAVAVSGEGNTVYAYADSADAIHEAESVVRALLAEHGVEAQVSVDRWHDLEQQWEDESVPLPGTEAEREAERDRLEETEEAESRESGRALWEVRLELPFGRYTRDAVDPATGSAIGVETQTINPAVTVEFSDASTLLFSVLNDEEALTAPFRPQGIPAGSVIPPGRYHFNNGGVSYVGSNARRLAFNGEYRFGQYYNGTRAGVTAGGRVRVSARLATTLSVSRDVIDLPAGVTFNTTLASLRVDASFSTRMFLNAFIQYNSVTRQLASNIRYQFIHHPLSDLFLVYNDTRFRDSGPAGLAQPPSRAVILKLTHLLSF